MATETNYTQIIPEQVWAQGSVMANLVKMANSDDVIRDLNLGWRIDYTYDAEIMKVLAGTPQIFTDPNGQFIVPFRKREEITAPVVSVAASGLNLIITFPAGEQRFRNGDEVIDNVTHVNARIISGGLTNVVTVEPLGTTLSSSTQFQAGYNVTSNGDISGINDSTRKAPLYEGFNNFTDYARRTRDAVIYKASDKLDFMATAAGPDAARYFWNQATTDCMRRINKDRAYQLMYSDSVFKTSAYQGDIASYRGQRNAVLQDSGSKLQQNSAISKNQFVNYIMMYCADVQPDPTQKVTFQCAKQALYNIGQLFPTQNVQYPVLTSVGGSDISGISVNNNVTEVIVGNIKCAHMPSAVLQNSVRFPQQTNISGYGGTISQNTIYAFTTPTIPAINDGGRTSMAVTRFVPSWADGGNLQVSTQPGAFTKIVPAPGGGWLATADTTGWAEDWGRIEGWFFQGYLYAMYEPTI